MPAPPNMPKNHHFVAQMHAGRFTDSSGKFHIYYKPTAKLFYGPPKAAFAETHLYTREAADGAKDTTLESWFSGLEGRANLIIEKVVTATRAGEVVTLTADERSDWDLYFYMQWKRTPDALAKVATLQEADERLTELFAMIAARGPEAAAEIAHLDTPEERARLIQSSKVMAIEKSPGNVLEVFETRGVVVLHLSDPSLSFAIGSLPVVRKKGDLRDTEAEVWLPVASDVAIGICGPPGPLAVHHTDNAEVVRDINRVTAAQSTSFAAASKDLVEDLTKFVLGLSATT